MAGSSDRQTDTIRLLKHRAETLQAAVSVVGIAIDTRNVAGAIRGWRPRRRWRLRVLTQLLLCVRLEAPPAQGQADSTYHLRLLDGGDYSSAHLVSLLLH